MKRCKIFCALFGIIVLSGCLTSKPSSFYVLSPTVEVFKASNELSVGVGPVQIPSYLERPQMVTRVSDTELAIDEFNRWSEPLDETITSALAVNLAGSLNTLQVELHPFKLNDRVDFQVMVDVVRFEYSSQKESVELFARWLIKGPRGRKMLAQEVFQESKAVGPALDARVRTMNELLGEMSERIAGTIESLVLLDQ